MIEFHKAVSANESDVFSLAVNLSSPTFVSKEVFHNNWKKKIEDEDC